MVVGLFEQYGALNSVPVWQAIQQGLDHLGIQHRFMDTSADVAVIWSVVWAGRMRANHNIWNLFKNSNRPVIVAEVGMLQRGRTWKLGVNGTGLGCYPYHISDSNRPGKLGIDLQPWRNQGQNIVVACQRGDSEQWSGQPALQTWLENTVTQIRQHTDRPVVVRPHPRQRIQPIKDCVIQLPKSLPNTYDSFDFDSSLHNAWCVVNWNSGPGSQAIINGVPAFVGSTSLAAPVANLDWSQIENPARPDRTGWLTALCHTEWTLEEIASGEPLRALLGL